ncbi:ABC transporter substrate-binding protein [Salinarchaeum laminariae]|uniref:ABC transporter substrate-binding protein n=1 Tax=Salinarchaeum laminariae TaxID=869888 RepID=UPI0020BED43A|nr:ABC transporter substrate-binding protein [Salinarchaeum laminariae]
MGRDTPNGGPTRREYVKAGGAALGGGLLAGCLADGDGEDDGERAGENGTSESTGDGSYTVSMAPMGEVTFEEVPATIFTRLTHHAGMAFALGRGDDVNSMHAPDYYDALWNQFTPRLEGVELDWTGLFSSWEPGREDLYDLDSDVHLADPASVVQLGSWDRDDLEEIEERVGPWFGNTLSDRHTPAPDGWQDSYEYYGLWEIFEKVAQVFKETDRYEALASIHDDLLAEIEANLPPESERPRAVMIGASSIDSIYAYTLDNPGFLTAHIRPLEPSPAFEDDVTSQSVVDMEQMAEADPDVILALGGFHPDTDIQVIRQNFQEHEVGATITAVDNDRIHAQGARYQGPIVNLFQLEMTAKQLYPDAFGDWPTYTEGPYPEIPPEEQLFDRNDVASIIMGEF